MRLMAIRHSSTMQGDVGQKNTAYPQALSGKEGFRPGQMTPEHAAPSVVEDITPMNQNSKLRSYQRVNTALARYLGASQFKGLKEISKLHIIALLNFVKGADVLYDDYFRSQIKLTSVWHYKKPTGLCKAH